MNKPSILIIEDDKAVKNLIATTLEMHDYHYIWADNRASCPLLPRDLTSSYWTWGFRTWTEWT